ncbi:MAG: zf-HC2 domain-containing protein, partial [Cellulosilyticaceae bacterium]
MKLSCTMCQDLIPLYVDELLSSESSEAVEEHLIHCTACQSYLHTLQQDLPQPLTTLEDKDTELLTKVQKRLAMTQYLFLLCGMVLSSFFVLTDNIFQNILFLPLIGFTGYFFTKRFLRIPFITSLVLYVVFSFKEASYYIGTSKFLGELLSSLGFMLFWAAIFFGLTLLGSATAVLLSQASKDFRSRSYKGKACTIAIYSIVIVITSVILLLYNGSNGNPITAFYARARMNAYLEVTYPDYEYALHDVSYNFKSGNYGADAYMYTGEAPRPFSIRYGNGNVHDDYYTTYEEDMGTSLRLGKEAGEQIEALLTTTGIPFYTVDAYTSVPLGRYTDTPYSQTAVTEPLELTIYKYTDTKESIEDFSLWCETLRSFLVTSGYPLKTITFNSDPHFMVARL